MRVYTKILALTLLMLCPGLFTSSVFGTHFMGVDISYECLASTNNCTYRIFHHTYYDCAGSGTPVPPGPPFPPSLQNFQPAACIQPIPLDTIWTFVSYLEVTPICGAVSTQCTSTTAVINGVLEARFYRDYNFCNVNCPELRISWGSCCRNGVISSGAANDGIYSGFTRINLGATACNSSPVFTNPTVAYLCAGLPYTIPQGAIDPDGDSLIYRLAACYDNATAQVGYNSGFSPTQPLGPGWTVSLDSITGMMTVLPNPGTPLVAALCIEVEEYRNGQSMGKVHRDMQINIISCSGSNSNPVVDSIVVQTGGRKTGVRSYEMCLQDTLSLKIYAMDADTGQLLALSSVSTLQGLNIASQSSNPLVATLTFAASQKGFYSIPLTLEDDFCPLSGRAVDVIQLKVLETCHTAQITDAPCGQASGKIDLTVTGPASPYQFLWSTGDTTEDIENLLPGQYSVQITDVFSVMIQDTYFVNASDIFLNPAITQPSCNNPTGSISLALSGGIPPYTYRWSTLDSTATVSNLPVGGYSVTVTDATGCGRHEPFLLNQPDSCFNIVRGRVFIDVNKNCFYDQGEPPLPYVPVTATPGYSVFTDSLGRYELQVGTGMIDIQLRPPRRTRAACPPSAVHQLSLTQVGNTYNGYNFGIRTDSIRDLTAYGGLVRVRPVDTSSHFLQVKNNGNLSVNGTFQWVHDSAFQVGAISPPPSSYNIATRTISWNFFNLAPLQTKIFRVKTSVPIGTPLGYRYRNDILALPVNGDAYPSDNSTHVTGTVRGSYDPNDKRVSPEGIGSPGLIEQHENRLNYNIRFQNTGNDTAFFVVVRDTIDVQHLDIFSFERLTESHPYQLRIEDDSVLVFLFDHINLPDSATDNPGSQGFISFMMHHQDTLDIGSQIRNKVAIYFDFNPPIITNTVLNTIFAYPEVLLGPDSSYCVGESIEATVVSQGLPPYDFYWSDGTIDLGNSAGISQTQVNDTLILSVRVVDALGIEGLDSLAVVAIPDPDATFSVIRTSSISAQFTVADSTQANTSWYWDFGDEKTAAGGFVKNYTYSTTGSYFVTLIAENICGRDTFTQLFDAWVGVEEDPFAQSIQLFPQPVQDISYLAFDNPNKDLYSLKLIDLNGRVQKSFPPQRGDRFEITRGDLPAGVYLYELKGKFFFYGKMVVR